MRIAVPTICAAMLCLPNTDADESKGLQECNQDYARWMGVEAPELGKGVVDRLDGPTILLRQYRGKQLLLFAFDFGNFVGGGSGLNTVQSNLEQLNRIRGELDAEKFAVLGFTEGPVFFVETELQTELQRHVSGMADFRVVNSIRARHEKLNEPYNMLARPGGIVIDGKEVIQAFFTEAMTKPTLNTLVESSYDDPDTDSTLEQGEGDGILSWVRKYYGSGAGEYNDTEYQYDWRYRRCVTIRPAPHSLVAYDNLNRMTSTSDYSSSTNQLNNQSCSST